MKFYNEISLESEQRNILFSSFAAISGVGLLSYAALPFLMGSTMVSLDLSETAAGILYSLEFIAAAISSIVVAPKIGKVRRRDLVFAGAIIVILGNLTSAWWCSYEFLLVFRPLTGIGAGLALACGNATIANAKEPAKIAGMMNVLFAGMIILLMLFLAFLNDHWGIKGIFFGLAGVTFIYLLLVKRMPQRSTNRDFETISNKIKSKGMFSVAGMTIFAVFFMFTLRDSMAWGFVERIGDVVGYSSNEMGRLLPLQGFIGLLGPIMPISIGFKFGIRYPLLIGLAFAGLTTYSIFLSVNAPYLFEVAVLIFTAGYFFAISYLTAYAATLDPYGRIVAASGSAMVLGVAAGPALAGYLITEGGYVLGAWAMLVLVVTMIIAAIVSLKWGLRLEKTRHIDEELTIANNTYRA
jgi:predicted MFS family arabinose efflux permease